MITQDSLEIEFSEGVDKVTREICFERQVMNSNHKAGIRKTPDDRRIGSFFCRAAVLKPGAPSARWAHPRIFQRPVGMGQGVDGWAHVAHYSGYTRRLTLISVPGL